MSIVIPAGHLAHTVVTIRCDSPHAAPHIECGFDEQSPFVNATREPPKTPRTFALDGRATTSGGSFASSSPGVSTIPQADLSVERGMDHRGHFVRLSFLPAHRTSHGYGQQLFEHEISDAPFLSRCNSLSVSSPNMSLSQEVSPLRTPVTASPQSMAGSPLAYSSGPITNDLRHEADSACLGNVNFISSSDAELMTALDSFMGIFGPHNFDYPMLDVGIPANIASSQQLSQLSEPASPDMSCASSSSSGSNSPTTPYGFFSPAATPTGDGACRSDIGCTLDANHVQSTPEQSLGSSTALPQNVIGPSQKGVPSNKTESRLLPCPQPGCKRQFKSTSTLGGHMKTHAGKGVRFPCSFPPCTEKFSRRHDQLRHEVYKHGKQCEWVCARCNSFFSYERSLEKHTCTMDKSRRGSMPYSGSATSESGLASGAGR